LCDAGFRISLRFMKTTGSPSRFYLLAVVVTVAALLGGCLVPDNAYLMDLNRNGKWREAERVGLQMLAHGNTFTHSQLCETYFHVVYAQTRMEKKREAIALMREYDGFRIREPLDPRLLWLGREMARLKDELGMLDEVQRTLVAAMEENGRGNYARARELCDNLLAREDANDVQRATAHFVAAVCSLRLEDGVQAEAHLAAFDTLKSALPPDHQALADEPHARQGLRELQRRLQE
jgi:hypothetical protein